MGTVQTWAGADSHSERWKGKLCLPEMSLTEWTLLTCIRVVPVTNSGRALDDPGWGSRDTPQIFRANYGIAPRLGQDQAFLNLCQLATTRCTVYVLTISYNSPQNILRCYFQPSHLPINRSIYGLYPTDSLPTRGAVGSVTLHHVFRDHSGKWRNCSARVQGLQHKVAYLSFEVQLPLQQEQTIKKQPFSTWPVAICRYIGCNAA